MSTASESSAETGVPWGCDVDSLENASALQEWLSERGLPPQKMAIRRVDVGERGLVALKNIRKGEKLLFVPPSLFITADSVSSLFYLVVVLEFSFHSKVCMNKHNVAFGWRIRIFQLVIVQ